MGCTSAEVCALPRSMCAHEEEAMASTLDDPYDLTFQRSSKHAKKAVHVVVPAASPAAEGVIHDDDSVPAVDPVVITAKGQGKGGPTSASGDLPHAHLPLSPQSLNAMPECSASSKYRQYCTV